jgi:hypothetical protein
MKSSRSGDVPGQNEDSPMGDSDSVLGKLFFSSKISALSPGSTYDASIRYDASLFFLHSTPNLQLLALLKVISHHFFLKMQSN